MGLVKSKFGTWSVTGFPQAAVGARCLNILSDLEFIGILIGDDCENDYLVQYCGSVYIAHLKSKRN